MKIFDYFRKRRALKTIVRILPSLLKKRYGKHKKYTERQIRKTIEVAGIDNRYTEYAYAIYLGRREFEAMTDIHESPCNYDMIRQEIADKHFEGESNFTIHDLHDISKVSAGGFFSDGNDFDSSGGDFGEGGDTD